MGIQNRDYYRADSSGGRMPGLSGYSMCQTLLIVNIVAFVLQLLITVPVTTTLEDVMRASSPEDRAYYQEQIEKGRERELRRQIALAFPVHYESLLETWGAVDPVSVSRGQIWRLLTYAFLHARGSIWHLVFNMLVLWMFGSVIEELLGRREFLAMYLAAAIFSGICHVLFGIAMHDNVGAVGASGALMAVSMLFAIYYPRAPITIYFLFTLEARWLITLYVIFDALPVLRALGGGDRHDGVAHAAHLGGLAFGYLYYHFHWRFTNWLPQRGGLSIGQRLVKWWTRPRLRVYDNPPDHRTEERPIERPVVRATSSRDLERRVDEILKKIKDEGEASLTEEERTLLRDASQAYKKRNT